VKFEREASEILVFDCEARPTAWISGDFVGKSMTAVSWSWVGSDLVHSRVLTREMYDTAGLLPDFLAALECADVVVGHYIRGFDLPLICGDLERLGWAPLNPTLTIDTKSDRLTTLGLSESLGNLAARYEVDHEKLPMTEPMWEEHNLWQTPRSVEWVRERVEGDVIANKDLYIELLIEERLRSPKVWDPAGAKMPRYRA